MKLSVVVPVYNEERYILGLLQSLYTGVRVPDEVIVADGRSEDYTVELIKRHYPQVIVVNNPERNAACGRNHALKRAGGDVIAFTDGDNVADRNWLSEIERAFLRYRVDGVGGRMDLMPSANRYEAFWGNLEWRSLREYGGKPLLVEGHDFRHTFVTANCAYTRDILVKLHGFDPYFANNGEDYDLCWRAADAGARLLYVPSAVIYAHCVDTVQGIAKKSFRNGISSCKLQKRYGSRFNFDPNIYRMLGGNVKGLLTGKEDADLNVLELVCHLGGKYYGSAKFHVLNF